MNQRFAVLFPLLLAASLSPAVAQTRPDAGSLLQQIERERGMALPKRAAPPAAAPAPMRPAGGIRVTVREFRFAGNTLLTARQLAPAVAKYLNRPLDFNELEAAAAAVADVYRQAGWIVRTYLPEQDIEGGIVTIQIVEAVFGGVRIEGGKPARIDPGRVAAGFYARQRQGAPLDANALDRALLLADDLPGVSVAGSLQPGAAAGETDLALRLADEPLLTGEAAVDNTGSRSTGSERLFASVNANSPLGIGDLFSLGALHTEGSDYGRVEYTVPVGLDGWRIGASLSHLRYKLVSSEFAALHAEGTSDSSGLEASYPLIRSRLTNLFLALNYDRRRFDNQSSGATTTRYRLDAASVALSANHFDNLGGGGANQASLVYVNGQADLGGSPNQAADAATTRTAGNYSTLRYRVSRQQVVTPDISLFARYLGQLASKNLDSAEKFYLGGADGVRAYPSSEGGGSEGQMLNVEVRWRLPAGFTLTGFHDWGRVTVNRNNCFAGAPTRNRYTLQGHGVSLAWQAPPGLRLTAVWARREGSNPNPTAGGKDQDGSLDKDRFWLLASQPF